MRALISGVSGQDGSYLAEQLLNDGLSVIGLLEPGLALPEYATQLSRGGCQLLHCDLADPAAFRHVLREQQPEIVYHLAALSHPLRCAQQPELSRAVNVTSVDVLCDWVRREQHAARVLVVSSSAVYGPDSLLPLSETSPMNPKTLYGEQKKQVREMAAALRGEGFFVSCAIPFNHESPRRGEEYVFQKICRAAVRVAAGTQAGLQLGDVSLRRDWGYAPEYAQAMRWMLEIEKPVELVLATGESHSVLELATAAFSALDLDARRCVSTDMALSRADEPAELRGDAGRAWEELGWEAETRFEQLVSIMVEAARNGRPA